MPVQKGSQLVVQLAGSRLVQSGDRGRHVCFEGLSVDGADVSRSMEHRLLLGARDIEIAENRKMIGGDTILDYTEKKRSHFLSISSALCVLSLIHI